MAKLEQEVASITGYVTDKAGLEFCYTDILPESFAYPAVYFPAPEFDTGYSTLSAYKLDYRMSVRFFDVNNQSAYRRAQTVANALVAERYRIPLLGEDGPTGTFFKVSSTDVKKIDTGVYGFNITWESIRTFDDIPEQ